MLLENFQSYKDAELKYKKAHERLKKLEQRVRKLYNSKKYSWIEALLKPLAKEMAALGGYAYWEIMGPFGLGNETSIWVWNTKEERENCKVVSLTVRPDLDNENNPFGFTIKDYNNKRNNYPNGSMGEVNDFNYGNMPPPNDATAQWFLSYALKEDLVESK